ncbi:MAG: hypothetical protein B7Z55_07350, partial [Planctomycetales bacterium 12-60-4]
METDERVIGLTVTPQTRRVTVDSHTFVELTGKRLNVRQQLNHHVDYERLDGFQLQVPSLIAQSVRFSYGGQELIPTWTDSERPRERIAEMVLPEPAIGEVLLQADWEQTLPSELWANKDSTVEIPLLTSRVGTTTRNMVEFSQPAWFEVASVDPDWSLEHSDGHLSRWSAGPDVTVFDGLLSPTSGAEGGEFLATRGTVQVSADRSGLQSYIVQVRMSGSGPHLNVEVPAEANPARFSWDGRVVPEVELLEFPVRSRRYTVPWPGVDD